jgi:hypothetical protein
VITAKFSFCSVVPIRGLVNLGKIRFDSSLIVPDNIMMLMTMLSVSGKELPACQQIFGGLLTPGASFTVWSSRILEFCPYEESMRQIFVQKSAHYNRTLHENLT